MLSTFLETLQCYTHQANHYASRAVSSLYPNLPYNGFAFDTGAGSLDLGSFYTPKTLDGVVVILFATKQAAWKKVHPTSPSYVLKLYDHEQPGVTFLEALSAAWEVLKGLGWHPTALSNIEKKYGQGTIIDMALNNRRPKNRKAS